MRSRWPGEFAAAGNQDRALAGAGQQRLDLGGRRGAVGQHEDPPPGQHRPVQRRPLVGGAWDGSSRHAHGPAQFAENFGWVARMPAAALQWHPQLPVGEFRPQRVRDLQGKRGLAHAGQSNDHHDRHTDPVIAVAAEDLCQPRGLRLTPGKVSDRRRQLADRRPGFGQVGCWQGHCGRRARPRGSLMLRCQPFRRGLQQGVELIRGYA